MNQSLIKARAGQERPYGDLTKLNTSRLILEAAGAESLQSIASDFLDLLGTSCAIYEKNGDYALGIFSSGWCQLLEKAAFRLCQTDDPKAALESGRWLCHESCWKDASLAAIEQKEPVDVPCHGALRLYAAPIWANEKVIGAINFGYGTPPSEPEALTQLAKKYNVPFEDLPLVRAMKERRRIIGDVIGFRNPVDGQIHWTQGEVVPLIDPDTGRPYQYYTVMSDVTKRKLAAKALQVSEERLRLSMQAANQGFYDLDLTTGDAVISPEYALMLGYDPADLQETNQQWLDRLHPDDRKHVESEFRRYVSGDIKEYSIEFRQRTKQGNWKWIWSLGSIVERDPDGKPLRLMGTHTDIDNRKASEEQMRHVQKLESLGVLAGGIAHDFNNLLMTVLGNADLALDSMHVLHPSTSFISDIKIAAQRAADLCRQMMAYAGKGRFVIEKIDLSAMVQEVGHILRVSVSKNASLRYDLAQKLPLVEADASQIRQIIMNLITNASDAVDDSHGIISVSTGQMMCNRHYLNTLYLGDKLDQGHYAFIEVSDTGIGMDAKTRERIFDPFFTTKFIGRGLGLAAILGIVRGHHGGIKLYSEPGRGTNFKVLFPAAEKAQSVKDSNAAQNTQWTGNGMILLVDDEPQVRSVASQMLGRLGFQVIEAADGMEAVEKMQQHSDEICCVFLDLSMPRMNGEEAFREIRRINKDVRVVLSSGYNEQVVTQRLTGKGLAGFIQKPFTLSSIRQTLQDILD